MSGMPRALKNLFFPFFISLDWSPNRWHTFYQWHVTTLIREVVCTQFIVQEWRNRGWGKEPVPLRIFSHGRQHLLVCTDMQRDRAPSQQLKEPISEGLTAPIMDPNCRWQGTQLPHLIFTPVICVGGSDAWEKVVLGDSSDTSSEYRIKAHYCLLQLSPPKWVSTHVCWG